MKKMTTKQKFYQCRNFTKCESSYLQKIVYKIIFVFLLGPTSNKMKMEKNENETQILFIKYAQNF